MGRLPGRRVTSAPATGGVHFTTDDTIFSPC